MQLQGKVYAPVERAWIPQLELELLPWDGDRLAAKLRALGVDPDEG